MKILLAGGCGYVGTQLTKTLKEKNHDVTIVDLEWFGNYTDQQIIHKDIFDLTVDELVGFDCVVFIAGLSNDPMADFSPSENFIQNSACPSYLSYIAKKAGVKKFIYASSCSVYGYSDNRFSTEEDPTFTQHPYGISKLQGERGVLQIADDNFKVIALRKGTVCGYSPRMRLDLVLNIMFKHAITTGTITVNNPEIWRPILSIQDAVQAYTNAIEIDAPSGTYNIFSDNYQIKDLALIVKDEIEKIYSDKSITINNLNIQDVRNYKVSLEKAKKNLKFSPQYKVKEIINDLIKNHYKFFDFDNDLYYNINTFKNLI
ncbi:MAG: SDR family oxidoreductase [Bacteroidota bacterium]